MNDLGEWTTRPSWRQNNTMRKPMRDLDMKQGKITNKHSAQRNKHWWARREGVSGKEQSTM